MDYSVFKIGFEGAWKNIKEANENEFFMSYYNRLAMMNLYKRKYEGIISVYTFEGNEIKIYLI